MIIGHNNITVLSQITERPSEILFSIALRQHVCSGARIVGFDCLFAALLRQIAGSMRGGLREL